MSTQRKELKNKLHESIENIDDETFLQGVKSILDSQYEPEKDISLNSYQKERIEDAKLSLEKGNYLTNEEADQLVEKWRNG